MSIAERAVAAHRVAQQHLDYQATAADADADIARVVGQLAELLGVGPHRVRPDRTRARRSLPLEPLTLHATDPDDPLRRYTFTYLDPFYDDESFFLLEPCPLCAAPVPLAEIRTLADLGAFLAAGPEPLPGDGGTPPDSYPDAFDQHPAHTAACAYRESQRVGLMRRGHCAEALDLDGPQAGRVRRQPVAERVEIPLEQRFPWITGAGLMVLPTRA
ncbi:hypothetical protein GXW83_20680 [Streptacidiphilus sp. PB12-B1b]|uniref:hypothetical protein n=1 Tax=Streptacidiphilus sp. PB12-B1b TaxID=2705012 RepID=UPI0015F9A060|nr:hypothetical protein [Streptacidiphilus sp. PB12-B1b]QMU77749.1 hypothetical protein GXW83_20680 [Streptacidiphilus sp. PB12-B1b]